MNSQTRAHATQGNAAIARGLSVCLLWLIYMRAADAGSVQRRKGRKEIWDGESISRRCVCVYAAMGCNGGLDLECVRWEYF